jgi:hypothetical protein
MLEDLRGDDDGAPKEGGEPQVEGVVSHTGQQDEAAAINSKISPQATEMLGHYIFLPQQPLNICRCEGICTQHEKGEAGHNVGHAAFVCGFVEKINSIKLLRVTKLSRSIFKRIFHFAWCCAEGLGRGQEQ